MQENKRIEIRCFECGNLLLKVDNKTVGVLYPYCKNCHEVKKIPLNVGVRYGTNI